ncbi:MAG: TIGR04076 family protein [Candidatus Hodarchaeales archaeon]|jgi:uncharacterized repeat protein (TIGR04076 family)
MSKDKNKSTFELFDLVISVERIDGNCTCNMNIGDKFYLKGGKVSLPINQSFCLFAMQSVFPLLPAKQRKNHPADWIETDNRVFCPDPECKLIMTIKREGISNFDHDQVSSIPLDE